MATAEKRAKAHKLLRNNDLMINPSDYKESFLRALNYLNTHYDTKQYRSWVASHYPRVKFGDYRDGEFRTLGALVRLIDNGNDLSPEHLAVVEKEYARLTVPFKKAVVVEEVKTSTPKPSIQDSMDEKVSEFMAEFNAAVDQYVIDRTAPKVASMVTNMGIKGPMLKKVAEKIERTVDELKETIEGKDKYLVEGYSNFKKVELRKLLAIYEDLTAALSQAKVTVVRKARAVKVKPPAVIAAKVKYAKEHEEYKLKGIAPVHCVGASEVWVFNTKYRKLFVYEAQEGHTLTFKGTTFLNFNIEKSYSKTVRKPEQLQVLNGVGKRAYSNFMKTIRGATGKATGRLNEECVIMAAFK